MTAIVAIAVIASCAKVQEAKVDTIESEILEESAEFIYTFGILADSPRGTISDPANTKSEFSAANRFVSWEEGEDFLGAYAVKDVNISYNQKCDVKTDPSLSFVLKSHYALEDGDVIYSYYPYNYINTSTAAYQNPNNVHLSIASAQSQDGDTFDSSAMPMVAKYAVTEDLAADTGKSVGTMTFMNLAGVLDFKVYSSNATYRTETVKSITFKANSAICGEFNYNLSGLVYETASTMNISGYSGTTITTTVTSASALTDSKATAYDVCMAVAPGSYTGVVEVVTDKAVYTYNVSSAKTVARSQILSLGVNLGTGSRKSIDPTDYDWKLVKSAATVAVGEWVAIAASGFNVALSTTQNDNNRGEVAITKAGDDLTATETMQMFEVVAGASVGQFAFKAINGDTRGQYLYAASSTKNYLRSQNTVDGNASWTISVTAAGVATVTAQGTNTNNLLKYNDGNSIFSAYSSGQKAIAIYILDDPTAIKLNASTTSVNFLSTDNTGDGVDVDFSIQNVASWTVVNSNTTDFDVDDDIIDAASGLVTITPKGVNNTYSPKAATVTVSATGADDVVINVSQAAKVASLTATPDKTDATKDEDMIEIDIESNVPWSISADLGTVDFVDGSDNPYTSEDYTDPSTASNTVYVMIPENTTGANRDITITIVPNEIGCGLSNEVIVINQLGAAATKLDDPEDVSISNISIGTKNFAGSWSAVDNATNYDWMISTASTAPASTSDASVKAYGNTTSTSFSQNVATAPTAGQVYYLYVKAKGTGSYLPSDYSSASAILYLHAFTTTPGTGDGRILSTISWSVSATNLGGYNSGYYAGVQFGTGSKVGDISLTSTNAWGAQTSTAYTGKGTIKKMVLWLNTGGSTGQVTASATIGGVAASSSGSVSKNSSAKTDWTLTSPITFTPASSGKTGVVAITATTGSNKCAGYICALEILSE